MDRAFLLYSCWINKGVIFAFVPCPSPLQAKVVSFGLHCGGRVHTRRSPGALGLREPVADAPASGSHVGVPGVRDLLFEEPSCCQEGQGPCVCSLSWVAPADTTSCPL